MTRTTSLARRIVAPALLALSLFAGVAAATPAEARINGPVFDTFSFMCLGIQNTTDALIAEYNNPNTTPARRAELGELRRANARLWVSAGCYGVFGPIAHESLPDTDHQVTLVGNAGVLAPELTAVPGRFHAAVGSQPVLAKR